MNLLSKLVVAGAVALAQADPFEEERKIRYMEALEQIDFDAVKEDIKAVLTDSKDFFPADYGNYGPFFIRMAWHCAGSYRTSDGEGGCDGGRQRFDPERSWADNTNLDKARALLEPVKQKYGLGLSWGDLIILTGTVSIESMGGPVLGFCAGRFDDVNGAKSTILGPNERQQETAPCSEEENGNCQSPLGSILLEHIYVDPHGPPGPDGQPLFEPAESVDPVRSVFARMGMNDSETVALIGGGHAFGKAHGACSLPNAAGDRPKDNPEHPWDGICGEGATQGIAENTATSGFEGSWTELPTTWTNLFFQYIVELDFFDFVGPGGPRYFHENPDTPVGVRKQAPNAHNPDEKVDIMMLPTDLALVADPDFNEISTDFATNAGNLDFAFKHAWYKLVTRDMGPVSRCFGNDVPPAQPFQAPLPERGSVNVAALLDAAHGMMNGESALGRHLQAFNGGFAVETAYLCAATYRNTDNHGGCNGARIRLDPEITWADRAPLLPVLAGYESVAGVIGGSVSDLIVLAGTMTLQNMASKDIEFSFCPGRVDAVDAPISDTLVLFDYEDKILKLNRQMELFGMNQLEYVALQGRIRSPEYYVALGYSGSYTDENAFSNTFAKTLLSETWTVVPGTEDLPYGSEYTNADQSKFITYYDFVLLLDDGFRSALIDLASDEDFFFQTFIGAWTKLMNADRYDGPVANECSNGAVEVVSLTNPVDQEGSASGVAVQSLAFAASAAALFN